MNERDGRCLDTGFCWGFDVRVQWEGGRGWFTTWAVAGPNRAERDLAIRRLRERAKAWDFVRVYIYAEYPPLEQDERDDICRFNVGVQRELFSDANRQRDCVGCAG